MIFPLLVVFLSSCTTLPKHAGGTQHKGGSEATSARSLETKKRLDNLIKEENYSGALDLIRAERKSGKPDEAYAAELAASLNGLAEKGMQYFFKKDYGSAGVILRQVLDSYPSGTGKPSSLQYSAEDIGSLVKICAENLREEGLREYRNGNLGNAIALWHKVQSFSKEDAPAIKKMIETATLQLKNLKELKTER